MTDNNQMQILGTGLNGLVGSKIVQMLTPKYAFTNLDIAHPQHPVDITQLDQVQSALSKSQAKYLIHCAAFTDVTAAWEQNGDKNGLAYKVNVKGTENIAQACRDHQIHLIHLSTAYIFDGEKSTPYLETDQPHPIEWYGQTKLLAEEAVQRLAGDWTILRIDQPFRSDPFTKLDVVRRIVRGLKENSLPPQFNNHYFGPTFIDDFVQIIDLLISHQATGLFHATSNESWNDYEFALAIASKLNLEIQVKSGNLADYLKTAKRPYQKNTALNSSKLLTLLKFQPTPIRTAIQNCQF